MRHSRCFLTWHALPGVACAWSQILAVLRHGAVGRGGVGHCAGTALQSSTNGTLILVCRAQALLLWVGVFNRLAGVFVRGGAVVWEDDYETRSPAAAQVQALTVLRASPVLPL